MTTTDSQNFKEIQEIDVHHVVTLEVDFPFRQMMVTLLITDLYMFYSHYSCFNCPL